MGTNWLNATMEISTIRRRRLRKLINERFDGSYAKFADAADTKASVISRFFMATDNPNARNIGEKAARNMEQELQLKRGYLDDDEPVIHQPKSDDVQQTINDTQGHYNLNQIPLISSVTAGNWGEIVDNFAPGDAESWITTDAKTSGKAFALKIQGDSMEPRIQDGDIIIVDPQQAPIHKSIVVVRQNGDTEATCKQLIIEGGNYYLQPINKRYPIMQMQADAIICGVAISLSTSLI